MRLSQGIAALTATCCLVSTGHVAASTPPDTAPTATALPPVTVSVIRETMTALFAPSADLLHPLTAFGIDPPKGVPTADSSIVFHVSVTIVPTPDSTMSVYDVVIDSAVDAPAADVVALYRTRMPDLGFALVDESTEDIRNDGVATILNFANPSSPDQSSLLTVAVLDFGANANTGVFVNLGGPIVTDIPGLTVWLGGLPMTAAASRITRWAVDAEYRDGGAVAVATAEYMFEITGRDLVDAFEAALEGSRYAIDPDASARPYAYQLVGGDLDGLEVVIDRLGGPGRLTANGTIDLPG